MLAANAANQSVDHRPSVMAAAPQYKQYFTAIANCQNVGSYAEDPASLMCTVSGLCTDLYGFHDVAIQCCHTVWCKILLSCKVDKLF